MTSESAKRLRATIEELEAELGRVDELDPETRELLAGTVDQLQETLQKKRAGEETDDETLLATLEGMEREFELQHPTLAGVILRMVEALRQLGI